MSIPSFTYLSCIFLMIISIAAGHQSIAYPVSISYERACRIGKGTYCPGPCPHYSLRKDVTPDKPQVTVSRGGILRVKTFKNNHFGGFVRWSLVKVKDMYKAHKHTRFAFFYSCADQSLSKCNYKNRKDFCPADKKNEYYQHSLRIPSIYDDGVYVLGFAWYGGLTSKKKYGFFGDYYDCTYVRIKGGPIRGYHHITFSQGRSVTGKDGKCKATANKLGQCRVSPCKGNGPLNYRVGKYIVPAEFSKGHPGGLTRDRFRKGK